MNNIKEIKEELILKHFNCPFSLSFCKRVIGYIPSEVVFIDGYKFKLHYGVNSSFSFSIFEMNNDIFLKISESGNLVFSFQHYEKNRNEIKDTFNKYLNEFVFHNLILKEKLEFKLPQKEIKVKEKVKKI